MRNILLLFFAVACASPADTPRTHASYDVKIVGGDVIDGSGAAPQRADVGIRGDTIAALGDLRNATARVTIDAAGHVVAPGFIDLLGNSEGSVLIDPRVEGKVRQGITTEVTGEGHSPGPLDQAMAAEMNRTRPAGFPEVTWRTLGEYMQFLEKRGSAINFALYIGATNAREMVLGDADRAPTAEELRRMEEIVDQAMREGAVGLSSALIYPPARFATTEELIALARVAGRHGGGYWTHLRNESDRIGEALDEAFRIGREAGVPVNIFHLKAGGSMRGRMREIVARIEKARADGIDVASNVYPYTATATNLTSTVPAWALAGGYLEFVKRLANPAEREKIAATIRIGDGSTILIRQIPSDALKPFERKRLDEIARAMNTTPAEAALRLFEQSVSSPVAIYFNLDEEDMKYALEQPWVAVGSDSGAVVGVMRNAGAHPRAYGTFPRILGRYVREGKLITLPDAVRKMTSLAASRAGLRDRGLIREGMKADIVVFNAATIGDVSTYEDPHHFSVGVKDLLVNGKLVLRETKMTAELPGRVLRRAGEPR